MTRIEMIYDKNIIIGFKMDGHAEYNPGGPDIVCAALSAMSQMTINGVLDWVGIDADSAIKENIPSLAILHFEIPYFLTSITTNQLFKSFEMYVEELSQQYEQYVKLERSQKNDM